MSFRRVVKSRFQSAAGLKLDRNRPTYAYAGGRVIDLGWDGSGLPSTVFIGTEPDLEKALDQLQAKVDLDSQLLIDHARKRGVTGGVITCYIDSFNKAERGWTCTLGLTLTASEPCSPHEPDSVYAALKRKLESTEEKKTPCPTRCSCGIGMDTDGDGDCPACAGSRSGSLHHEAARIRREVDAERWLEGLEENPDFVASPANSSETYEAETYGIGDLVHLVAGGPTMTVGYSYLDALTEKTMYTCRWFDDEAELHSDTFFGEELAEGRFIWP